MSAHQAGCCCPGCCACLKPGVGKEYIIDIGSPGLVDNPCAFCNELTGEFTVQRFPTNQLDFCQWRYGFESGEIEIVLTFDDNLFDGCQWTIEIKVCDSLLAVYQVDVGGASEINPDDPEVDCLDELNYELIDDALESLCTGTLPDPITVRPA